MDEKQKRELIKSIIILVIIIVIAAFCARKLIGGETLAEFRDKQVSCVQVSCVQVPCVQVPCIQVPCVQVSNMTCLPS